MTLPINIETLITKTVIECERIEFKQGWNPKVILHSICAFANDFNNFGGGYIVVGVAEDNGQAVLPPAGIAAGRIDGIQKELLKICHYLSPNYFPVVEPSKIQGKHILVIWCPPGDMRPYKAPKSLGTKDKHTKVHYIRRMSSTVTANESEQQRLMELTAKVPFDNRTNYHASIDDLNLTHIASFLKEVNSSLYTELAKLSLADICRNMGIARGADEEIKPLNVGLLMFTDDPTKYFRGARIELVEYQDEIGDKYSETIFSGPIWQQLKDALRYVQHSIIKEQIEKVRGQAESRRFYNYPYEALEEAIANAIFHKGYDRQNPIEINIRHDCIEILSFPGPIPPVNNEALKQNRVVARDYRNSRLGDFLKELRLTEGRGTGIPKIRRFLQQNGSPEPKFETDAESTYFLTTFYPHPESNLLQSGREEPSWHQDGTKLDLTEEQMQVIEHIEGDMALLDLMKIISRTDRTKFRNQVLNPLIKSGLLELTRPDTPKSPKQKYRLTDQGKDAIRIGNGK